MTQVILQGKLIYVEQLSLTGYLLSSAKFQAATSHDMLGHFFLQGNQRRLPLVLQVVPVPGCTAFTLCLCAEACNLSEWVQED